MVLILIIIVALVYWYYTAIKDTVGAVKKAANYKSEKEEKFRNNRKEFIRECERNGIYGISDLPAKDKTRLELIAKRYGYNGSGIEKFYQESQDAVNQLNSARKAEEISELKKEEKKKYEELTKYSNLIGREKRVKMSKDLIKLYEDAWTGAIAVKSALKSSAVQKESDGAVRAGAMMAIGGTLAGVDSMINTEKENAQIRAQNEANLRAIQSTLDSMDRAADSAYDKLTQARRKYSGVDLKLVSDAPKSEVQKRLKCDLDSISVSETGAFTVKAKVKLKEPFEIFDDVPAVVDGTLVANLYQKDTLVGRALLVLPIDGVDSEECTVEGINIEGKAKKGISYTVRFKALNVWEMEK